MAWCIYHSADLDGHASAAAIRYRHPQINMIPIDYGDEFPLDQILQEKHPVVFMVDFCPSDMSIVEQLIDNCTVFVWIDHHITSIQEFYERGLDKKLHDGCVVQLDENHERYAACELAYMWMFSVGYEKIPYYFNLLGKFDTWQFDDQNVLPFQYGMRAWLPDPKNDMSRWKRLIQETQKDQELFEKLLDRGHYILQYEEQKNASKAKSISFELEFAGWKAIAANEVNSNFLFFESIWETDRFDLAILFGWKGDHWKVSFYTDKDDIDVSKIATNLSSEAGGRPSAAGCKLNEIPKELKEAMNGNK